MGGNVGDVRQTFDTALLQLERDFPANIVTRSGIYQTIPVGNQSTTVYLNAVCEVITSLLPQEFLGALHQVENQLGRVRDVRWGARPIDLDLLSYSDQVIHAADLIVPHHGIIYRRFVLDPLAEADPHWLHPELQVSAAELIARLQKRPLEIHLTDFPADETEAIKLAITIQFPEVKVSRSPLAMHTLCLRLNPKTMANDPTADKMSVVDLSRIPGTTLERVESVLTAIFDTPNRIAGW